MARTATSVACSCCDKIN
ncbi:MAG TPA: hypothetical protein DDY96_15655 [Parabacteroides distasonis]|nr:hypothetical protein [Parabacteroides distasonis]